MDNKTYSDLLEIEQQLLKLSPNLSVFKEKYGPCDGQSPQWRRTETYGKQPSNPAHFDILAAAAARIAQLPESAFRVRLPDETLEYRARFIDGLLDYLLQQTSRSFRSDYLDVIDIPDGFYYRVELFGLPTIAVEYVRWLQLAQLHEAASSRLSAPTKSGSSVQKAGQELQEQIEEAVERAVVNERKVQRQKKRDAALFRAQVKLDMKSRDEALRYLSQFAGFEKLTEQQVRVLELENRGLGVMEIAACMDLDHATVIKHLECAKKKLKNYQENRRRKCLSGNDEENKRIQDLDESFEALRDAEFAGEQDS